MNLYNCEEIKFSYTETSFDELKFLLEEKTELDKLNQTKIGKFDFFSIFESDDITCPQVCNPKSALKALFFPCRTTQGTVMVSNLQDGWGTLCHQLSKFTKHGFYSFRLDEENKKDVMNSFDYVGYTDKLKKIRVVYSMTDPRWKFYQVGEMLWFENESYYNNRIIRKRINKYILTEYCNKLSLNITDEDFWNIKGDKILFSRKYS